MEKGGAEARGEKQAEQLIKRRESCRATAIGGAGGVRSCPMATSSTALISIFAAFLSASCKTKNSPFSIHRPCGLGAPGDPLKWDVTCSSPIVDTLTHSTKQDQVID